MITKHLLRYYKRIYAGDIIEILNGEYTGYRFYVKYDENDGIDCIHVINPIGSCYSEETFHLKRGQYILWKSPLKNKLKRLWQI